MANMGNLGHKLILSPKANARPESLVSLITLLTLLVVIYEHKACLATVKTANTILTTSQITQNVSNFFLVLKSL